MSYQEKAAEGSGGVVFVMALVFVFLILAAQYESWSIPLSVLLGTPIAVFGAIGGLWLARLMPVIGESYENNVFAQIGLVMLIGMAAKNAILIVEFAKLEVENGRNPVEAAMEAARSRFRPILMTAFSFILGVIPLLIASGAGAEARKVMGMTVFSGMLVATMIGVLVVPALFVIIHRMAHRKHCAKTTGGGMMLKRLTCLLLPAMLGACAVGPDYQAPQIEPGENFVQPAEGGESIANLPWWELFQDPVLQQLIQYRTGGEQGPGHRGLSHSGGPGHPRYYAFGVFPDGKCPGFRGAWPGQRPGVPRKHR